MVLCLLLEAAVRGGLVSPLVVANPSDVGAAVIELLLEEGLFGAFLNTLATTLSSLIIAVAIGVPLGAALYRYKLFGLAYEPWFAALFAAPMVLLYPLFLVMLGRSVATIITMGAITGIIPIVINTRVALRDVPRHLIWVGRSFNCSGYELYRKVILPAAAPTIFTGVRLGLIYALVNIIGVEFLINFGGLGRMVSEMYDRFDIPAMYAAILFIILVSFGIFACLQWLQDRVRLAR